MNTTSTVTPISETPKQPQQRQTAKDIIAANVKSLIEQLEAGHSDALTAYLDAMSRFHNYSFGNILEIARQRPTATRVAGLYAWNQLGRKVKKGEKGIRILAPIVGIKRKKDEEASKDITKQNTRVLVGFRNAYVFDVEQTEGAELPTLREMTGTVGENRDRLVSFIEAQGIELSFTEKIAPALGMSYGGKIAILPGQSEAEEFSTLVHELAHEMLHKAERRTTTTKVVRETEAEAIAFVIGKAVGLETGSASADYIQLYHGNASLLAESLEVIQQTSGVILAALQPPTAAEAEMRPSTAKTPPSTPPPELASTFGLQPLGSQSGTSSHLALSTLQDLPNKRKVQMPLGLTVGNRLSCRKRSNVGLSRCVSMREVASGAVHSRIAVSGRCTQ